MFPDTPRVIYNLNPLEAVICQLRFPAIVILEKEPPAQFQDRVRREYPKFKESLTVPNLPEGVPPELLKLISAAPRAKLYELSSEDDVWHIGIHRESFSFTCHQGYERWEQFKNRLEHLLALFVDEYQPSYYSRIGLRYRNVIDRAKFSLDETPFSELLQTPIAAELSSEVGEHVANNQHQFVVDLGQEDVVRVQHGLAQRQGEEDKDLYLIDSDFFTNAKVGISDAIRRLDRFHSHSGNLFRWCIKPKLDRAMEPREVAATSRS